MTDLTDDAPGHGLNPSTRDAVDVCHWWSPLRCQPGCDGTLTKCARDAEWSMAARSAAAPSASSPPCAPATRRF